MVCHDCVSIFSKVRHVVYRLVAVFHRRAGSVSHLDTVGGELGEGGLWSLEAAPIGPVSPLGFPMVFDGEYFVVIVHVGMWA